MQMGQYLQRITMETYIFHLDNERGFSGPPWPSSGSTGDLSCEWGGHCNHKEERALTTHHPKVEQTSVNTQDSDGQLSRSYFLHSA